MQSIEIQEAELLRNYLLGKLDAEATDALEQRLLADGKLFELAEAMEGELLAAYARGELAPDEREVVLRRLTASPHGRERLALARGLNTLADERTETKPHGSLLQFPRWRWLPLDRPAFRAAVLAASLSVVVAGLWLAQPREDLPPVSRIEEPTPQFGGSETTPAPQDPGESHETPPPEPPGSPPPVQEEQEEIAQQPPAEPVVYVQEIELSSDVTRGSESYPVLDLRSGTQLAQVRIVLEGEELYDSFTADVSRLDTGDQIAPESIKPVMVAGEQMVVVSLPADKLYPGQYQIKLNGLFGPGEEPVFIGTPVFEVRAADR